MEGALYHLDCHDGGIGDEDCPVHVLAVDVLEEDVEFRDIEALQLVQTCRISVSTLIHTGSVRLTLQRNRLIIINLNLRQPALLQIRPPRNPQVNLLLQHNRLRKIPKRTHIPQVHDLRHDHFRPVLRFHGGHLHRREGGFGAEEGDRCSEGVDLRVEGGVCADFLGLVECYAGWGWV